MYKTSIFLSMLVFAALIKGCIGNVAAQTNEATPTSLSVKKVESTATPEVVSKEPPVSCPVTLPEKSAFIPPAPYDALGFEGYFWFGSSSLWTSLPQNGVWYGLPNNPGGYTQKVFWWRDGYVWDEEPEPNLVVTGERLDAKAPSFKVSEATNAYAKDIGSAMLAGVDFPTLRCWKITGKYNDKAELSFVIWIAP
jgi:hypothetical protein